jgi:hypothetical protein
MHSGGDSQISSLPTIFKLCILEIGGYYRMHLRYFYVTNSGNPSHSSFWPNEQLDAIINLFKVFSTTESFW